MSYITGFTKCIFTFALVAVVLGATGTAALAEGKTITIDGSTTVGPIVKAFAEYTKQHNPDMKIVVSESGSGNGAKSLMNGTCHIAAMSRFMKDKEYAAAVQKGIKPVPHVIAVDGLAIIVHPSNPVKGLTMQQLRDIYPGKIKNWSELGGADRQDRPRDDQRYVRDLYSAGKII
ncbi:MAG: substrate-binding domain-containing protein [Planctomycetia bacterium]|jgi:phosphate transport system substrate-binding protein